MMKQDLLDRLLRSPQLPSLPAIALEVIDLVQEKDVNIKQIANTIQHDPALSSKILKTVNSSFYGQAHTIGTISHALVVLGLNSVKTLALGLETQPLHRHGSQEHRPAHRAGPAGGGVSRRPAARLGHARDESGTGRTVQHAAG